MRLPSPAVLRISLVLLAVLLAAPSCRDRGPTTSTTSGSTGTTNDKELNLVTEPDFTGFRVRLSEADPTIGSEERVARSVAETTPLGEAATKALIARLPPLQIDEADRTNFAKRPGSMPPPRTGETVPTAFPPPPGDAAPAVEDGPLTILRHAPEGDVPIAPHLTVTFSQPMVSITSQDESAKMVPVALSPEVEGRWRWLGTKTVIFEPASRFPMATEFRVTTPAGTTSAIDNSLAEDHTFTFRTPPPRVVRQHPTTGPQGLQPVLFMGFDQAIDAEALLPHLSLKAEGRTVPLRMASEDEVMEDTSVRSLSTNSPPDRWIAVTPKGPLSKNTGYSLTLAAGAPSAEGPRTTEKDQSFSFRTYGPLTITEHRCSWGRDCPPQSDWNVRFSNPLDAEFDGSGWTVSPEVRALSVHGSGQPVTIRSIKKGRTTYTVTVPAGTKDVFGQTLGKDQQVTYKVGPADAMMTGPGRDFLVLDPASPPTIPIYSVNQSSAKLSVYRATSEHWGPLSSWMRERHERRGSPPLEKLANTTIAIDAVDDDLVETPVDLSPWLKDEGGVFLHIEPPNQPRDRWRRTHVFVWVQRASVGLAAFADHEELLGWATDLQTGAPAEGVELQIVATESGDTPKAVTDAEGLASIELPTSADGAQLLVARKDGREVGFLPQSLGWWSRYPGWLQRPPQDSLRWMVWDDRGLYRPDERVAVKGVVRRFEASKGGGISDGEVKDLRWQLYDSRGNEIDKGMAKVDSAGTFDVQVTLPRELNLGSARLALQAMGGPANGRNHNHYLNVAEFRRPEFEVKASSDPGPYILGEHAIVEVEAAYFAGGGLPEAETTWTTRTAQTSYQPPGWDGWSFGMWTPWWRFWDMPSGPDYGDWQNLQGVTDGLGTHRLRIHFEQMSPPRPWTVLAEATVMDVNRQAWTARRELLVHPAAHYPALRLDTGFVEEGEEITVGVAAVDIDGAGLEGRRVEVVAERLEWTYSGGQWSEVAKDAESCTATSAADPETPTSCSFTPKNGGTWRLTATSTDEAGRPASTELRFWVRGGKGKPNRKLTEEELTLVPDAKTYAVGDTAKIFVQAPFAPWEGLVTYQRQGLVKSLRFTAEGPTHVVEVPIEEAYLPNLLLQVDAVGEAERLDDAGKPATGKPKRPAFATGQVRLDVPPVTRTLGVSVTPREADLRPGGSTVLDLVVTDVNGEPVSGAQLAVAAVDESVLSLTGHSLPNPLEIFYATRQPGVSVAKLRQSVVLADLSQLADAAGAGGAPGGNAPVDAMMSEGAPPPSPEPMARSRGLAKTRSMPMDDAESDFAASEEPEDAPAEDSSGTIQMRTNFDALALFAPAVPTDTKGRAEVALSLPDSLTRYRIMVVAVEGDARFGTGESTVTARKPVMVRPSPPRFLNFGDTFELPFVIQNQTREPLEVDVAVRTSNMPLHGGAMADGAALRVTVPAEDRAEVRFPAAADMAGIARFQVLAVANPAGGEATDAAENQLPVWTPATSEAFATYGVIDEGAIVQPVQTPGEVWPQFGGLEVTTSSTAVQALTDAVIYLTTYPYECAEQLSSRILGIAALRDVLTAFDAEGLPPAKDLETRVTVDLETLKKRQNRDGGFGFWRRGQESWPWVSIHAAHAMARAETKGYEVDKDMRGRSLRYLKQIERHIPSWYSLQSRRAVIAYSVLVRELMGDTPADKARQLFRDAGLDGLSNESLAFLLPTLDRAGQAGDVEAIERHLMNRVSETAGAAHFVESYTDGAHVLMHSNRRSDGVILEALTQVRPNNDLIPKVVEGLLGHRTRGRWGNTQENVFVLLALDRYFQVFEKTTPDFVARIWLGQDYAGDFTFKGRTTDRALTTVPMAMLARSKEAQPLTLQKDGAGRMYYRIGMTYAPRSLTLEPADRGFAVERVYEAVDDPSDVTLDEDGTWRVAAGARVRVRLTMVATGRRVHVALVDPLPAGLEAVNPELATSATAPPDEASSDDPTAFRGYWWWWRPWYEHENLRDERVEAFTNLLWEGVHTYTYIARATTPGNFVVPPTKAEEMYNPETFGRSATNRMIVE